ncbi:MAG: carboxypeptidase-like regulatory domain-containing protein [Bacteroidales bacterium]
MSDKQSHRSADEFLKYLKGELSEKERHSLERELERNPFAREAMEGLEQVTATEAEEDLLALHDRLRRRTTRRKRIVWYGMAAAAASILIVGTLFLQLYDFNPSPPESKEYLEEAPPTAGEMPAREVPAGEVPEKSEPQKTVPPAEEQSDMAEKSDIAEEPVSSGKTGQAGQNQPEAAIRMEAQEKPEAKKSPEVQANAEGKAEAPARRDRESTAARRAPAAEAAEEPAPVAEANELVVVEAEPVSREKGAALARSNENAGSPQLTGTIRSASDHTPLPGASLEVEGENAVSISDMEGRFSVPVTRDTQSMVTASYAGMESQVFALPVGNEVELVMQPEKVKKEKRAVPSPSRLAQDAASGAPRDTPFISPSPQPTVGYVQFYRYVAENGNYPSGVVGPDEALVILRFTVTTTGELREIVPVSSPGSPFTEEAIRLLQEGPEWIPAMNEDGPAEKQVTLRIELKK